MAKRPPFERPRPLPEPALSERENPWRTALAATWVVGFCLYFSSSVLPNNPAYSRVDLWALLPEYAVAWLTEAPPEGSPPSGWKYLPQRFDLLAVAAGILLSALAVGRLALRMIGLSPARNGEAATEGNSLSTAERFVFAGGLGLSLLSLTTLLIGLCGGLRAAVLAPILGIAVLAEAVFTGRDRAFEPGNLDAKAARPSWRFRFVCLAGMTPFVAAAAFGAMIPESDFDVREYHLEGPKEYFLAGRISFLEHNVYTSFPFLTEMLTLLGMTLRGDWYRGALAGKVVLMSFAPLTAVAVYCAARRLRSAEAGWLGALIYLSTPWTYRISIIAYAEGGLSFFLAAALLAVLVIFTRDAPLDESSSFRSRLVPVTGFLAGSGMACKYPGVLSVVIPLGVVLVVSALAVRRKAIGASAPHDAEPLEKSDHAIPSQSDALASRRSLALRSALVTALLFTAGVFVAVGPWLLKNLAETGNPVYPLLYRVFGGRDWDAAMNAKWNAAHSPDDYDVGKLWFWLTDVSARNDWLSPLLYAFSPLALFTAERRRSVLAVWGYVGWLFATWWLFTHRLDRFWVPMLPAVAVLAGVGAGLLETPGWKAFRNVVLVSCLAFNLRMVTSGLSGPNSYLIDLEHARPRVAGQAVTYLNTKLPSGSKVLCVGEAEVFDVTVPVVYNTVFDRSIFQDWMAERGSAASDGEQALRSTKAIRDKLHDEGVTHLFVNWAEILRYRTSYGYTDFVTRQRLTELVARGVLKEPKVLSMQPWEPLGPRERDEVLRWSPALKTRINGPEGRIDALIGAEVYEVRAAGE